MPRHADGGKGDDRRPGAGFEEGHQRIWPEPKKERWTPPPLPDWAKPKQPPS